MFAKFILKRQPQQKQQILLRQYYVCLLQQSKSTIKQQQQFFSATTVPTTQSSCCRRLLHDSTKKYPWSYEYPWATEPPEITRTKHIVDINHNDPSQHHQEAKMNDSDNINNKSDDSKKDSWLSGWFHKDGKKLSDDSTIMEGSTSVSSTSSMSSSSTDIATKDSMKDAINENNDPFDDYGTLSSEEIQQKLKQQKEQLSTKLTKLEPITQIKPSYIPSNVSSNELQIPETIITTLDNGIRVVTQETYGQVSTVGVVSEVGSRHEIIPGTTHLLELLSFGACGSGSNVYPDASAVAHQLQDWGAVRFCSTGREQSVHCIDLLRPNVANAMEMLSQVLLEPHFLDYEIDEAKQALLFQCLPEHMPPEMLLLEALQQAAYGTDQQLGKSHFVQPQHLHALNRNVAIEYWINQFINNPNGIVIGGAGVQHTEFVELVNKYFGKLQQNDTNRIKTIPSTYRGGECIWQLPESPQQQQTLFNPDGTPVVEQSATDESNNNNVNIDMLSETERDRRMTRVTVALEVGGWHSDTLVTSCVLQTLLGGGSSFSAGGPGKGMYSRLYRQVLNRYHWVEAAEAYTNFHTESGLFGISGSCPAHRSREMIQVLCEHLLLLTEHPVSQEELIRARNMLKNNVLSQLESRLILFEDMSRQILTYNHRENIQETCNKIDNVTSDDIMILIQNSIKKSSQPTIAAVGIDITNVPKQKEVAMWFK